MANWGKHLWRLPDGETTRRDDELDPEKLRSEIEPWLSAMFQSEHLSLLLGNGFTTGVAAALGVSPISMAAPAFSAVHADKVAAAATVSAKAIGRGAPNVEDYLRTANQLRAGLAILGDKHTAAWSGEIAGVLKSLIQGILEAEAGIHTALRRIDRGEPQTKGEEDVLSPFLLSFASRSSSRERLSIFTTNYDRLVEQGCEREGLRVLDRFVGLLEPTFRSSRLEVDVHYNPPGIRGEPRFLEGVVKLTKLHGSVDWIFDRQRVRRVGLPFGGPHTHPAIPAQVEDHLVVFPMSGKDVETSEFPYSELFRDFSAAICRPNSVLVTYGYGFGDTHINTALQDMLTIPSTHLVIISYDTASDRIVRFVDTVGHSAQVSLLIGPTLADIKVLTRYLLPKPAIDRITSRRAELLRGRLTGPPRETGAPPAPPGGGGEA